MHINSLSIVHEHSFWVGGGEGGQAHECVAFILKNMAPSFADSCRLLCIIKLGMVVSGTKLEQKNEKTQILDTRKRT